MCLLSQDENNDLQLFTKKLCAREPPPCLTLLPLENAAATPTPPSLMHKLEPPLLRTTVPGCKTLGAGQVMLKKIE